VRSQPAPERAQLTAVTVARSALTWSTILALGAASYALHATILTTVAL
jgi:hypothetical protein